MIICRLSIKVIQRTLNDNDSNTSGSFTEADWNILSPGENLSLAQENTYSEPSLQQ